MVQNKFHKSFRLNNQSFSSIDEIVAFTKSFSQDIYHFLESWFSTSDFITVQTSGSTGIPKSISLKKDQMVNSALATGVFFNVKAGTKALLCLPVNYIAGKMMLIRALTLGWHLDIIEPNSTPLKRLSKTYDFTAMVSIQVENSIDKLNQIKKIIIGGGAVSNLLQERLQCLNTEVFATYGMTETITHIAVKKLNNLKQNPNFYEILPNINIYKDYRNCLVVQASKVSEDIIFTNDVIKLISDTEFEWLGRFDNVINSGGIKLYPEKIEEKLSKIIKQRFFVASIPDNVLGQKLVLILEGEFRNYNLNDIKLTKYEIPKQLFFIEKFVETKTKKIQRKQTLDLINF
ncbi:AMP-binding protein [Polaribacter aquimarinus]|uniref:O-succinylbenzoic acid--CoA ligase n=1 Tax=Polaribacter aquimarinus TaxID=2100726 RepID=A0A2U2JAA6_9FLAO|nr:AMP-binding protein [Polaribacter aquimarinus]PWG05269.1 O-succinylbenzoic acid--CoA ligase [Polaribacter aquimarinus]